MYGGGSRAVEADQVLVVLVERTTANLANRAGRCGHILRIGPGKGRVNTAYGGFRRNSAVPWRSLAEEFHDRRTELRSGAAGEG
jgi:hypothetical protein